MPINGDPRERLADSIKSPYETDGDVWKALIDGFTDEFEELEAVRQQIRLSKFVTDADAASLERLAELFGVERRTNESVSLFRVRVQIALRQQFSTASIRDIRETVGVLLGVEVEDIAIENAVGPATADLGVPQQAVDDADLTVEQLVDEAEALAAGGVRLEPFAVGAFEHAALGTDTLDEDRGYGTLADDTIGGSYASLLN